MEESKTSAARARPVSPGRRRQASQSAVRPSVQTGNARNPFGRFFCCAAAGVASCRGRLQPLAGHAAEEREQRDWGLAADADTAACVRCGAKACDGPASTRASALVGCGRPARRTATRREPQNAQWKRGGFHASKPGSFDGGASPCVLEGVARLGGFGIVLRQGLDLESAKRSEEAEACRPSALQSVLATPGQGIRKLGAERRGSPLWLGPSLMLGPFPSSKAATP